VNDTTTNGWTPLSPDRTARAHDRTRLFLAAMRAGVTSISAPALGRLAGVSGRSAWRWLRGVQVTPETDQALRRALGLDETA
jgi:hypothetical protein